MNSRTFITGADAPNIMASCRIASVLLCWALASSSYADALDVGVSDDPLLGVLAEALEAYDIDVTTNLNARDVMRLRLEKPRLGRFPDLPPKRLPLTDEILNFEAEYLAADIGGLAIVPDLGVSDPLSADVFLTQWLLPELSDRVFITFFAEDIEAIEKIQQVATAYSFDTLLLTDPEMWNRAGNLYSTASQRLALDSRAARRYDSDITEFNFLGERVRRNSNSLFREGVDSSLARNEPAVFRKETLGDEFNQSTIREIIVPGGVALGETAKLPITVSALRYSDSRLLLIDDAGEQWQLPPQDSKTLKALFDFVNRSETIESDAIVDIDAEGRVRITAALRDTDAGFDLLHADTEPFKYVRNLSVTKSVIIDTAVDWINEEAAGGLAFETEFEVRFLSADSMRIAQTRVALQYQYQSYNGVIDYTDAWGREVRRLDENLDYSGLGTSVAVVADYAGWIALFRKLETDQVPFLQGRYEFMTLDKSGRRTPTRY